MAWIIKDLKRDQYYRQRSGPGWYSDSINDARLYTSEKQAQKTINEAGHHVTYPGDRDLKIIEVKLIELEK